MGTDCLGRHTLQMLVAVVPRFGRKRTQEAGGLVRCFSIFTNRVSTLCATTTSCDVLQGRVGQRSHRLSRHVQRVVEIAVQRIVRAPVHLTG